MQEGNTIDIFPNPVLANATIAYNLKQRAIVSLAIYNLIGDKVRNIDLGYQTAGNKTITLEKGDLSPGMYILQISTGYNKAGSTAKIIFK